MDEPRPPRDLLAVFLRPYPEAPYSDRARLRFFVTTQLLFAGLVVFLLVGNFPDVPVPMPVLVANLSFQVVLLVLVLLGQRGWAEGLSALVLPLLFLFAVVNDPRTQANNLATDLLLAYALFCLILVTLTTSRFRWIIVTGLVFLVGGLWFRLSFQLPFLPPEFRNEVIPSVAARFAVFDVLATYFLLMVQRVIHRANFLADAARLRVEEVNHSLEATLTSQSRALQEALDQVRTAQRTLSEGEKLSTVGRFIAGIAHEINTPLGAIESSGSHLQILLQDLRAQLLNERAYWTLDEKLLLGEILAACDLSGLSTSSLEQRKGRRLLDDLRLELSADLVEHLGNWGLFQPETRWIEFLGSPRGPEVVAFVGNVVELNRCTGIITAASGKAAVYVRELRKFIVKDKSSREPAPVSVTESLETFLLIYQNQLRGRIEVVRAYPRAEVKVLGQPDRLLQIWSNLISNAVGAMGASGELRLEVRALAETVEVRISDNGPGIPESIQERIFEPFFSTKGAGEGMGLGLDIVRTIVEEHRGKVAFVTRPGQTVFTVTLPLWAPRAVTKA